jgi:hypothetical protein
MSELSKELEDLHRVVVRAVRDRVDTDGSADDLRLAMQLLKQNAITANLGISGPDELKSRMAGKLNFSTINDKKVLPFRPAPQPSADSHPHTNESSDAV